MNASSTPGAGESTQTLISGDLPLTGMPLEIFMAVGIFLLLAGFLIYVSR